MSIIKRNNVLFPTLMDEFFKPDWLGGIENNAATLPAVNIKESETAYELELAIPGQKKEDFNIEIDKDVLTISMEVSSKDEEVKEHYTRKEFTYNSFKRAFTLPETVASEKIKASYENGILAFMLPKKEEALPKPKRLIKIGS
ncbi:MAG: Hsp20/alpha crystallin family protein [Eudoraea sp.]|nr:Hsp20/alpha crystallin family protein [Eudoraea sp.]